MTRIAIVQMTGGINPERNAHTIVNAINEAAEGGAAMLFTPELSNLVDQNAVRATGLIVSEADDYVLARVREAARATGIWVHLGSLTLLTDDGMLVNRGLVIDSHGQVLVRYDKLHLFDVDLPTGESWRESALYTAGNSTHVVATPAGLIGLAICYDVRFPDLFRALSDAGAEVFAVPSAFTRPTGAAHWHVMLRARAIEAGAWVIATAQTGCHEDGRETWGHSMVVDPWGDVVLDLGEQPALGFVDILSARTAEVRMRVPALRHRRRIPPVVRS